MSTGRAPLTGVGCPGPRSCPSPRARPLADHSSTGKCIVNASGVVTREESGLVARLDGSSDCEDSGEARIVEDLTFGVLPHRKYTSLERDWDSPADKPVGRTVG